MAPFLERLQVEEGFLSGLDLHFSPGLNVIIGPRGVGKTSVIELIRLCLAVPGISEEFDKRSREHAQSILGPDGRVTITIRDGTNEILVSRGAGEELPRQSSRFPRPRVFSQAEIERVGLEAKGRLKILDEFADVDSGDGQEERSLEAAVRSLTLQVRQLSQDLEAATEQIATFASVQSELAAAASVQENLLRSVKKSASQQARLTLLNAEVAAASVRRIQISNALGQIETWRREIANILRRAPKLTNWPAAAGAADMLAPIRTALRHATAIIEEAEAGVSATYVQTEGIQRSAQANALALEEEARKLRKELEQLKAGAGTAAHKVGVLQGRLSELQALKSHAVELAKRIEDARRQRGDLLATLQQTRDSRYAFRSRVAKALTVDLGPAIQVSVEQGGDAPAYVGAIQASIRGSGLHHNTLAPQLAQAMSPRELVEAVEARDSHTIARLAGIAEDRAAKAIEAIARSGAETIITAPIHDCVTMKLLDGNEYKGTTELSTGQRCTVVLSVLLGAGGRGLVIDQPEDHLDNAFIVKTLIESIRRRKTKTQLIFTTHNANIPVLAEADLVALLGSDGQRGFLKRAGPLTDEGIVQAITSVMEGGYDAFKLRATFYRDALDQ